MAGECGDEVRILDKFVNVAYEGTTSHMAATDFIDRLFLFLTSNGIQDRYKARNSALGQHDLDIVDFVLLVKHLLIRYSEQASINRLTQSANLGHLASISLIPTSSAITFPSRTLSYF